MTQNHNLLELVPAHLKPLFPLEERLLEAAPLGSEVSDFEPDELIDRAQLGDAQSVRSELLIWLLTDPAASKMTHHKGINLRGAKVVGLLDLEDSSIEHPLRLRDCSIEEEMALARGSYKLLDFSGCQTGSINAYYIRVQYYIRMRDGFKAKGEVDLAGAEIGGHLDCIGGEFENPEGCALSGNMLTTKGSVLLRDGFKAKGEVRLRGADIGGSLSCDGGEFENPEGCALSGNRLTTKGSVLLRDGFKAKGEVRLRGANIGANLSCDGGEFENPEGSALNAGGLTTKLSVLLRGGFKAKGEVNLTGADIGGNLSCTGGGFKNPEGFAFSGGGMKVTGHLIWSYMTDKPAGKVNLINAKISHLIDDEESWPESGSLHMDGLTYSPFVSGVPADSESRLRWLNLRNPNDLSMQPYEQLIHVFRQMGLQDDAREVAIAKRKAIHKQLKGLSRIWSWILGATIDYGYRPQKVIGLFILPILLLGILIFGWAFSTGVMEPTNNQQAGQTVLSITPLLFDPVAYSVDVFLPIVDLHQEDAWQPNTAIVNGIYIQYYMYFHILAGWFFTTLAVAAVTGLVRRD